MVVTVGPQLLLFVIRGAFAHIVALVEQFLRVFFHAAHACPNERDRMRSLLYAHPTT